MNYLNPVFDKNLLMSVSTLGLAYVGDGVYELLVRTGLLDHAHKAALDMHRLSVSLVNAGAQAQGYSAIEALLTEEEAANLNVQSDIGTASFTKLDDGTVILQVIDIPASDLGKEIHITGDVTVSYTPLRWAKAVIDNNIGSAKLQRLANAVITYSNAADSIF